MMGGHVGKGRSRGRGEVTWERAGHVGEERSRWPGDSIDTLYSIIN